MSIQTIDLPATYQNLLPLYLLALKGGEAEERYMHEIQIQLSLMAKHADKWVAHCENVNQNRMTLVGGKS